MWTYFKPGSVFALEQTAKSGVAGFSIKHPVTNTRQGMVFTINFNKRDETKMKRVLFGMLATMAFSTAWAVPPITQS